MVKKMRLFIPTNKKGLEVTALMGIVLAVIVVFIIIFSIVFKVFDFGGILGVQQAGFKLDSDKDGLVDGIELKAGCPCTSGETVNDGCPADFTEEQKNADRQTYNTDTGCGVLEVKTPEEKKGITAEKQKQEEKYATEIFKHYRSVEIFGGDDWSPDPEDNEIRQACAGWVGSDCPAEANNCKNQFSTESLKNRCWIMASEDDIEGNDCGQAKVDEGTLISLKEYQNLKVDTVNDYLSVPDEGEPKNLFVWKWKSKPEYGSLICHEGFWYGCKEANEGKEFPTLVNGQKYKCAKSEWIKT